jgi:hypothetical protein
MSQNQSRKSRIWPCGSVALATQHPISRKVGTNFTDKLRSPTKATEFVWARIPTEIMFSYREVASRRTQSQTDWCWTKRQRSRFPFEFSRRSPFHWSWSSSWYRAPLWGPWPASIFVFSFDNFFGVLPRAPSLTWGQCNCWLVRSLRTNNHTLPSQLRLCSLFVASYDSQGLRWRYSNPLTSHIYHPRLSCAVAPIQHIIAFSVVLATSPLTLHLIGYRMRKLIMSLKRYHIGD